jgi:hypothetical protein
MVTLNNPNFLGCGVTGFLCFDNAPTYFVCKMDPVTVQPGIFTVKTPPKSRDLPPPSHEPYPDNVHLQRLAFVAMPNWSV